jgi:uncharacterized membrane protein
MLIPLIMIVFGWLFQHGFPKSRSSFLGYRTTMSMKNDDTWRFAHEYCGRIWLITGLILFAVTSVFMVLTMNSDESLKSLISGLLIILYVIPLLVSVILTEKALEKTFDTRGKRKKN